MAREELVKVPAVILGSRLRAKRRALHMSQHQLGGEDFSPSYVSAVERGKIRPSLKALYILADRLGEPVTYFLQDEGIARSGDLLEETIAAATIAIYQDNPGGAIAKLQSVPLERHTPEMQARVHLALGQAYIANHQPAEAISHLQEALRLAESAGNASLAAHARLYQGNAYYQQQKAGLALEFHRRCLQAVTDGTVKDLDFALSVYASLGEDLLALGQEKDALAYYDDAMRLAQSASNLRSLAAAQWEISTTYKNANDLLQARVFAQKSLATFEALHMLSTAAGIRNIYASILSNTGEMAKAEAIFLEARSMGDRIGDAAVSATATIKLGEIAGQKNDYAQAEKLIRRGIEQAMAQGNELVAGQGLVSLAQVYVAENQREDAEKTFQAAISKLEEAGASDALSKAYFRYGQALVAWGESAKGSAYLEKAYLQTRKA